jgi:hypothetical protein
VTESRITRLASGTAGLRTWRVIIRYDYAVGGRRYTGKRIRFDARYYPHATSTQAVADDYPVGATVRVFYDPGARGDPSWSRARLGIGSRMRPAWVARS